MNENNEANLNAAQTVATLPPAPNKKTGKSKLLIGVAAVCALAAVVVAVKIASTPDPKETVEAAFTATAKQQQAVTQKIYENVPAAKLLFEGRDGAASSDFALTVKSIEDNPYASLANAILQDAVISGNISNDPENKATALDASFALQGAEMLSAHAFVSPELVSVGVPTFTQTTVSFNPDAFAQDYTGSALNTIYPMDAESLGIMQGIISGEIEYINALSSVSSEQLLADIIPIFKGALTNATYTYDRQSKKYVVNIPGEDLKDAILSYYRYIYFESQFGTAMEKMMSAAASASTDQTYEDIMNETLTGIEESLPNMDAALTLDIKNGLIKNANLTCTPVVAETSSSAAETSSSEPEDVAPTATTLSSFVLDCGFDEAANTAKLVLTTDDATSVTVDATANLSDNAYAMDMAVAIESSEITFNMPLNFDIESDGTYSCTADMAFAMYGTPINAGFAFDGTAALENDVLTISLPGSRIYASTPSAGAIGTLVFDYDSTNTPLTETLNAPESTPLFSMDAQQFQQLSDSYSVGYESLVGQLLSLLMS